MTADYTAGVPRLPWLLAGLVPLLLAGIYDTATRQGWTRLALQLALGAAILAMHPRVARPPALADDAERAVVASLRAIAAALALLALALGVEHVRFAAREGTVRLDIGQSAYRAALVLGAGENPYGEGMILDPATLVARNPRVDRTTLASYWRTMDPKLRLRLVPRGGPRREAALVGYKYGPADLLTVAPFAWLLGPAGIPVANLVFYAGFLAALWALLGALGVTSAGRWLALVVTLADPNMLTSCLRESSSDVRALLPLALALLLRARGRPAAAGAAIAVSLAMKLAPAVAFLPLLVAWSRRAPRAAVAFLVTTAALFAPFAVWDAYGLVHNVLLWSFLRESAVTSWVHDAPPWLAIALRGALAAGGVWLAARLALSRTRAPLRDLALLCLALIAAASTSHNNYMSWVTWLAAAALATAWLSRAPGSAAATPSPDPASASPPGAR